TGPRPPSPKMVPATGYSGRRDATRLRVERLSGAGRADRRRAVGIDRHAITRTADLELAGCLNVVQIRSTGTSPRGARQRRHRGKERATDLVLSVRLLQEERAGKGARERAAEGNGWAHLGGTRRQTTAVRRVDADRARGRAGISLGLGDAGPRHHVGVQR